MTGVSPGVSATTPPFYLPAAELALSGLSIATVVGFGRVFDQPTFLPPMLAVALATHLLLAAGRRRGASVSIMALVSAPAALLLLAWLVLPGSTLAGLPTGRTVSAADAALREAWQQFLTVQAPAPPHPGFVIASCVALYFAVFLADWAAFRLWSSFESVVPAGTLFVFCALLGAPSSDPKTLAAAAFLAALLLFLLLHRVARQESSSGWLAGDRGTGRGSSRPAPVLAGAALVAVAVLGGSLIGPALPGAGSPPVVAWRSNNQSAGERKAISPLVKIRDRLLNQANVPLFDVTASRSSYWRLTSLDTFDGEIWKSQGRYGEADGELPGDGGANESEILEQRYTVQNLGNIWAPAAYRPIKVADSNVTLSYNKDSSTLIVDSGTSLDGASYTVQSRFPQLTPEDLNTVTNNDIPSEVRERYLELPTDFSREARDLGERLLADIESPYAKAKALQDFFRGNFTYSTELDPGHGENAITNFLKNREGFCEQFAGTYAAMARAAGLPARVAVGFTPGVLRDPNKANTYSVTGRQTHAWPEVYLGRYGWVMFEPTPGRGAPNTSRYTGVPEEQDVADQSAPSTVATPTPPGTVLPVNPDPAPPTSESVQPVTPTTTEPPAPDPEEDADRAWWVTVLHRAAPVALFLAILLAGLSLVTGLYLVVVRHVLRQRRLDRRARATDPSRQVLVAWQEALEALQPIGVEPRPTESHDEFAFRVAPELDAAGAPLVDLAEAANHADYARDLVDHEVAVRAAAASAAVVATAERLITPAQQWRHRLDPRTLLDGDRRPQHTVATREGLRATSST